MVVANSHAARSVSGSRGGTVAKSENPADILTANCFHHGVGGNFRVFEVDGDRIIAPRIFQLMAPIGDVNEMDAEFVRGVFKTARLVSQLRGEEEQSFRWIRHARWVPTERSDKSIGASHGIFHLPASERRWIPTVRG